MLRTYLVLAQVWVLGASISAQQTLSSTSLTSAEKTGRTVFQTRCAMCHVGQQPATEMANPNAERRPATLGPLLSKANTTNEAALRQKIANGSRLMPGYKYTLTDEQIGQVIAFMKTIERPLTRIAQDRAGE